jgi:hypothetical protein
MKAIGLAIAAVVAVFGVAMAAGWQTYVNERFGSTADVPVGWRAGTPPENGDGLVFTAPDGQASVTVSGSLNIWDTIDEAFAIYETPEEGETITYKHRDKHGIVVSKTKGDRILYRKPILSCRRQVWNSIAIEYPAAEESLRRDRHARRRAAQTRTEPAGGGV